jgi:hypothetical protein
MKWVVAAGLTLLRIASCSLPPRAQARNQTEQV